MKYSVINYKVVSRKTGKLVPNQESYTIKETPSGKQTIYKDGKFVGYAGKGTAKEQANIERLAKQRAIKEEKEIQWKRTTKVKLGGEFETLVSKKESIAGLPLTQVPVLVKSTVNYANYLNDAMNSGFISEEEAKEWLKKYKGANSDDERTELWGKVKQFLTERGYQDSR